MRLTFHRLTACVEIYKYLVSKKVDRWVSFHSWLLKTNFKYGLPRINGKYFMDVSFMKVEIIIRYIKNLRVMSLKTHHTD